MRVFYSKPPGGERPRGRGVPPPPAGIGGQAAPSWAQNQVCCKVALLAQRVYFFPRFFFWPADQSARTQFFCLAGWTVR
jgi:hypothetical protein